MVIYDKFGSIVLDIDVDDDSYRYRAIMNGTQVVLYYSLTEHVEVPVGSYIEYQGVRYTLWRPENFKKHGTRNLEYTVEFGGDEEALKKYKVKDLSITPNKLIFSYTATPRQLLQLFVDNLNLREGGWKVGKCIEGVEKLYSFNNEYILDALNRNVGDLKTEWNIANKTIDLCKVEFYKDDPLALSYGKGNGFLPGTGRANTGDKQPIVILYVQGGERNIDASKYGSTTLLLPKDQEIEYEGRKYHTSKDGTFIYRSDRDTTAGQEDGYDGSHIYPSRVGTISEVIVADADKNFYDIIDTSIPDALDYSKYRIAGQRATIKFESGRLAGREFDLEQTDEDLTGYVHSERRFKIVPAELDGQVMPNETFRPAVGDKYAIFGIALPDAYICDNITKTGASWDMLREAVRCLYENEDEQFSFTGELKGSWAKKRWLEIGGKILPGGYVLFSDTQYQPEGVLIRITGVRDYINNPHSPEIELSNVPVAPSKSSELGKIDSNEVIVEEKHKESLSFTMRRYLDMVETGKMLEKAIEGFSASINPVTVSTMQIRLGAEQLQFRFVNSKTNPSEIIPNFRMDNTTKVFSAPAPILQHMSLGITKVSPTHTPNEYKFWDISAYTSPYLGDDKSPYYLYAKCSKSGTTGIFELSKEPHKMEEGSFYYFLVGTLGTEWENVRSFTTCYGFTEILPGRMVINLITSTDGKTYFNLVEGVIGGKIHFDSGTTGYENIKDKPDLSIYGTKDLLNAIQSDLQNQIDDKIETYYQTSNPWQSWPSGEEPAHVGDLWYNTSTKILQRYVGPSSNTWSRIEDADAIAAAEAASTAQDTADGKRRVFLSTPYPPYDAGDQWIDGYGTASGTMRICVQGRQSGRYVASDWQITSADGNTQASIDRGVFTGAGFITFGGSAGLVGSGDVRIWSGGNSGINGQPPSDPTFRVKANGDVESRGSIYISNANGAKMAGFSGNGTSSSSIRIWAGHSIPENAAFKVYQNGGGLLGGFEFGNQQMQATDGNNSLLLSGNLLKFNNSGNNSWCYIGGDVFPSTMGSSMAGPIRIDVNRTVTSMAAGNIGAYFDVRGATGYDDVGYQYTGNHALYIHRGGICGIRPRLRRVSTSQTLSTMDTIIHSVATSDITLTLPIGAENGQVIVIRKVSTGNITVKGRLKGSFKEGIHSSVVLGNSGLMFLAYDSVNNHWVLNAFDN